MVQLSFVGYAILGIVPKTIGNQPGGKLILPITDYPPQITLQSSASFPA